MAATVAKHQAGDFAGAEAGYREALKHQPRNGDALRLLGGLQLQGNRHAEALITLNKALLAQPGNPEIFNNLGVAKRSLGDTQAATAYFRQALKARPDYPEALNNLGSALQAAGASAEAAEVLAKAVALKPDYVAALRNLGIALREAERSQEAIAPLQAAVKLAPRDAAIWGDLGLALHRAVRLPEAVTAFEQALTLQPANHAALTNLASVLRDQGSREEAVDRLLQAQKLRPDVAEIAVNLGALHWDMNRLDLSLAAYDEALRLSPRHPEALINRGAALWALGRGEEAAASYRAALAVRPDHPEALTNLGALAHETGQIGDALGFYEQALVARPDFPGAAWRKSLVLLARGDYEDGWKLYETGVNHRGLRGISPFQTRRWNGKKLAGRLLIWSEQGLGDSLHFVRYAELCKQRADKVIVFCPQPLVRLYRSSPFIDEACDLIDENIFDAQASLMSLPHLFGTTLATVPASIPYLQVETRVQEEWDARIPAGQGLKVGLVWAGGTREGQVNAHLTDRKRSLSLAALRGLFDIPEVQFYNLQKGPPAEQIDQLGLRAALIDLMPQAQDFADTAALINRLDLVITVDTSVAHLAGALGKPVWVLSRYDACWRWLQNRADSPWYPTARIFGQPAMGDWDTVVATVTAALAQAARDR